MYRVCFIDDDHPNIPIVFYSRKATFEDAVRCLAADGVWWLVKIPTGDGDEETQIAEYLDQVDAFAEQVVPLVNEGGVG